MTIETAEPRVADAVTNESLLSVIYPVYDLRGDAVARIRLWTREQGLAPEKYRVIVVAGTDADFDEADIRKVLRPHDMIVRADGIAGEPVYWNAGARIAGTPWLLFTEGHSMPNPDCLSALADWTAANPNAEAVNFSVENVDAHIVAGLLKRWFARIHTDWGQPSSWRRLHRTAFAIRSDVFTDAGPFEPAYGHFAPQLLSARLHQRGREISLLPTSSVVHDDARQMSAHHTDTADYVRGEMDARTTIDPVFFEAYFGSSPLSESSANLPESDAQTILTGILVAALAAWRTPAKATHLARQALGLVVPAAVGLRLRAAILGLLNRADEFAIMHLPLTKHLRWKRFILAHGRTVRIEQMLWFAQQPPSPLPVGATPKRRGIIELGSAAIVGVHAIETLGGEPFRWTRPVFLFRLASAAPDVTVTLETRNLRGTLAPSDLRIVAGGRLVTGGDVAIDPAGNIMLRIRRRPPGNEETGIVVISQPLHEVARVDGDSRPLGLPLFSIAVSPGRP